MLFRLDNADRQCASALSNSPCACRQRATHSSATTASGSFSPRHWLRTARNVLGGLQCRREMTFVVRRNRFNELRRGRLQGAAAVRRRRRKAIDVGQQRLPPRHEIVRRAVAAEGPIDAMPATLPRRREIFSRQAGPGAVLGEIGQPVQAPQVIRVVVRENFSRTRNSLSRRIPASSKRCCFCKRTANWLSAAAVSLIARD